MSIFQSVFIQLRTRQHLILSVLQRLQSVPLKKSFHFHLRLDVLHAAYSFGRGNISYLVSYQHCNCAFDRMTPSHQDISPPDTPDHHWADLSIQICSTCCSHVLSPELFFTRVKLLYYNIKYHLLKQHHHKQILRFRHHLVRTLLLLCCHLIQTLC